jgi:hypothetical protein
MNTRTSIPAVCVQSLPDCCVVCHGGRWVMLRVVRPGAPSHAPVRCPHCTSTADLIALVGVQR